MRQQKLKTGHDKRRMTTKTKNRGTKTWQKKDDKDFRKKHHLGFLPFQHLDLSPPLPLLTPIPPGNSFLFGFSWILPRKNAIYHIPISPGNSFLLRFREFWRLKNHMPYAIYHIPIAPARLNLPFLVPWIFPRKKPYMPYLFSLPWILPRHHYVKTLWFSYPRLTVKPTAPKHGIKAAAATVGDDVSSQAPWHVTHHPEEVQLLFSHFPE